MKTQVTLNKSEIKLLLDGLQDVLIEENDKSRRPSGWKATARYLKAEALEERLRGLIQPAKEYRIAYVTANGDWDVVETFTASSHEEANDYAGRWTDRCGDYDYYVLDAAGRNINAHPYDTEPA